MTQPPDWWSQLSPGIHNAPARAGGELILPFAWQQLEQIVRFFVDAWLAKVAVALGAIEIFGWSPYAALVGLGQEFQAAKDNWDTIFAELSVGDISGLLNWLNHIPGEVIDGITVIEQQILNAIAGALGHPAPPDATPSDILAYLQAFPADLITGAFNLGNVQIGTTSLDDIFNGTGQFIGVLNSAATGALNSAITYGGHALSTVLTNITASTGGLNAAGLNGTINSAVQIGSAQLSSIFNGTGQFIGVLNSSATGALNSAITYGGYALSTVFSNITAATGALNAAGLTGQISSAAQIGSATVSSIFNGTGQFIGVLNAAATGALNTAITVNSQAIGTVQANAQGIVNGINNAAAGLLSGGSTLLADAATNLGLLFGSAPQYLQGLTGAFGQSATNAAFAAAAGAQAAASSQLAQQQAAFAAVFNVSPATAGNTNVTVDFTSMANAANMAGVMSPGNTNIGITSGAAARQVGTASSSDVEVFPTQTTTDYQVITATLGSLNNVPSAYTEVAGRVNSTRTTRVVAAVTDVNVITLGCWVSGSWTFFAQNTLLSIASGGVVKLVLGDPASSSPYAMQVLYNGTPVITYTDTSHVSQVGASYQYVGLAMGNGSINSGKYPPAIRSVTYQDNPPTPASYPFSGTPTAGTKGRMYVSNDVGLIQRDNGSAWEYIWGGPLGYFTKPPSSSWSWVNQGAASTATELGGERITAPSSTRNFRLRTRSLSPSSNYSAVAYVEVAAVPVSGSNLWLGGIGLRNSSSGSFISFGPYLDNSTFFSALAVYRWTNATTISANSFAKPVYSLAGGMIPNWLRIRDDGTNRYFDYSNNGVDWITVYSEGRTAFITPDQFCFGLDNEGSGADAIIRLRSLSGIS